MALTAKQLLASKVFNDLILVHFLLISYHLCSDVCNAIVSDCVEDS